MRVLRFQNFHRMRWKNGGGETTEIVISPSAATVDDFEWRVSMAAVVMAGPFSAFPDIDRSLAIIDGNGIKLSVDGAASMTLTREAKPFSFPGDVPTFSDLIDGPIVDLNVMSRRGVVRHTLERIALSSPHTMSLTADHTLILVLGGACIFESGDERHVVCDRDCILAEKDNAGVLIKPADGLSLDDRSLYVCRIHFL